MSSSEARTRLFHFVCIEPFHRLWVKHGLTEDDLSRLENEILAEPRKGDEIRGSGGFRKLRLSREGSGQGKSGSDRVLYLYIQVHATVLLVGVFGKNEKADISKADANGLARIAVGLKAWAKARHEEWLRQTEKS